SIKFAEKAFRTTSVSIWPSSLTCVDPTKRTTGQLRRVLSALARVPWSSDGKVVSARVRATCWKPRADTLLVYSCKQFLLPAHHRGRTHLEEAAAHNPASPQG